jgi:mannose-1-phosphate guanylyltransferase
LKRQDNTKAVILAGGLGTRLRPYTLFVPKPMLPVGHRPILEHIVEWLKKSGFERVVISTGYLGRIIEDHFGDGSQFGVGIEYARSTRPLGIAGQLLNASPLLGPTFVCLYGDAILDFDLGELVAFHRKRRATLTMALMTHRVQSKYGVIDLARDGRITAWREKPFIESVINVGCYAMDKSFLKYIPREPTYGMKEAFDAAMAGHEPIFGLRVEGSFRDIGDRAAYREADEYYSKLYGKVP